MKDEKTLTQVDVARLKDLKAKAERGENNPFDNSIAAHKIMTAASLMNGMILTKEQAARHEAVSPGCTDQTIVVDAVKFTIVEGTKTN